MANVVEIVIKGINKSKQALTTPINDLGDLKKAAIALGPAFVAGATTAAVALGALVKSQIDVADETLKMSQRTGVSTEALSTLRFVAGQTGTSLETMEKGLKTLAVSVDEAARGNEAARQKFSELGVAIRDSNGQIKSADVLYRELADKVAAMPDGLAKTAFAAKAFGLKMGPELIPMLNQGAAGIAKLEQQARALGLEIGGDAAAQAERFNDSMDVLKGAVLGAGNQLAKSFLPGMTQMIESFTMADGGATKFSGSIGGIIEVLKVLGKIGFTVINNIDAYFRAVGTAIAGVGAAMFQLITGNFAEAKAAVAQTFTELGTVATTARDNLRAIWTETETGPRPANVKAHMDANAQILESAKTTSAQKVLVEKAAIDQSVKLAQAESDAKIQIASNLVQAVGTLAEQGSAAAKAAAIVQATINAYQSITKTLAEGGAFAIPLAISTGALAFAQVAKIAGLQDGGELGGNTPSGDRTLFRGNSGEWVFNKAQLNNLAAQLDEENKPVSLTVNLEGQALLDFMGRASRNGRLVLDAGAVT